MTEGEAFYMLVGMLVGSLFGWICHVAHVYSLKRKAP